MNRIGIFGGRFDPIHIGHLIVAQDILEILELNEIIFLLNYKPPHKEVVVSFEDRLNMLESAVSQNPRFESSDIEARLDLEKSYTVPVLKALKKGKEGDFFLIIGDDEYINLNTWHRPEELHLLATIVVIRKTEGTPLPSHTFLPENRVKILKPRIIEISSTEIRERLKKGLSVSYLLSPSVEKYIREHSLYKG